MIQFWNIFKLISQYFLHIYVRFYPFLFLSQFNECSNFLKKKKNDKFWLLIYFSKLAWKKYKTIFFKRESVYIFKIVWTWNHLLSA